MARRPKRSLHPLRMVEALEALNEAAGHFAAVASTTVTFMRRPELNAEQREMLAESLDAALAAFNAAMWLEE